MLNGYDSMINHCLRNVIDGDSVDAVASLFYFLQLSALLIPVNCCDSLWKMLTAHRPLSLSFVNDVEVIQQLTPPLDCHVIYTLRLYRIVLNSCLFVWGMENFCQFWFFHFVPKWSNNIVLAHYTLLTLTPPFYSFIFTYLSHMFMM